MTITITIRMSFTLPSFNNPGGSSSQSWPNWGSFQPSTQSSSSTSANANNVPAAPHPVSTNAPYVFIPVPMPHQQLPEPPKPQQTYHMSFVNNESTLNVRLVNNRTHTITTNMVGKGTKFECEVPIDQNVDVTVTVLSDPIPPVQQNIGIIAQVDNDPFGCRHLFRGNL